MPITDITLLLSLSQAFFLVIAAYTFQRHTYVGKLLIVFAFSMLGYFYLVLMTDQLSVWEIYILTRVSYLIPGNHALTLIGHYTGSYVDITVDQRRQDPQYNALARSLLSRTIDAYDSWDLQYRYTHTWGAARLGTTILTAGVLDVFNADLPYREPVSVFDSITLNYDGTVFDPRGRRFYLRALWQF